MKSGILIAIIGGLFLVTDASLSFAVEPPPAPKSAPPPPLRSQPRELGTVSWARDLDMVLTQAKRKNMPVMVIFTEVPGCKTCVDYGQFVLSHPLIAEAIQNLFEPVAVFNNVKGADAEMLKSFDEAAMNNPVVRIIDADRKPLAPRVADNFTSAGIVSAMTAALKKTGAKIPGYLGLLEEEALAQAGTPERAVFAMHCFWEGEAKLGAMTGVVETRIGTLKGREVVDVTFDPRRLAYETLVKKAMEMKCADHVFTRTDAHQTIAAKLAKEKAVRTDEEIKPEKDQKHHMAATLYRFLPMTLIQASRVNAALAQNLDPAPHLSPMQLALFAKIQEKPDGRWQAAPGTGNLARAWNAAQRVALGR